MQAFSGISRNDFQWRRNDVPHNALVGQKIAIIGGTNGIGRALALALALRGAEIVISGRTFRDQDVPHLRFMQADLTCMKDALQLAKSIPAETLDMVIFTTGILAGRQRAVNPEGIELDLAVSYLNRFVMVREMAPRLGTARTAAHSKPRVFIWGFPGTNQKGNLDDFNSERSYNLMAAHSNTVIGNEALVLDSAKRFPTVNFFGMNPGLLKSNIRSGVLGEGSFGLKLTELLIGALFPSVDAYAQLILPLLASPDIENQTGAMFNRKGDPIHTSHFLTEEQNLQAVVEASERLSKKALAI